MLVLTRKSGQAIVVGDFIEITIVQVRGDSVRIGIAAPASVSVKRKELIDRAKSENSAEEGPAAADS